MQIDKIRGHQMDQLFKAMLELKDLDECYEFFDDLGTISELQSLAQRLEVAQMLMTKMTYDKIQSETGASTATISRVRRCVDYGSGGYGKVLGRLYASENEEEAEK
ncbi:MAG TPA: YerC/YecD family TrpR-related protein [Sporosarcina psychrophila]|uniref:YerC/YecD family TrpR-related protein n=1 Tax=Sporosarcina psychrophila TaxID=1476 RepID=A0A921G1N8_SPOPS|nr:YerC/YecD family TrpR-related protein [Sporosarcina psychrophila]